MTRHERDNAARNTLLAIADLARRAEFALWEAVKHEREGWWGTPDSRQHAEELMAELRLAVARLGTEYGPEPVRVLSIVAADAVADSPTDEEIDDAAAYEALVDFAEEVGETHSTIWGPVTIQGGAA